MLLTDLEVSRIAWLTGWSNSTGYGDQVPFSSRLSMVGSVPTEVENLRKCIATIERLERLDDENDCDTDMREIEKGELKLSPMKSTFMKERKIRRAIHSISTILGLRIRRDYLTGRELMGPEDWPYLNVPC